MSARSAWPSSKASHNATATPSSNTSNPVDANASQLGTSPSGITRIALPSAKNSVAMITTPATRHRLRRPTHRGHHRPERRHRDHGEHHPVPGPQRALDAAGHPGAHQRQRGDHRRSTSARWPGYARCRSAGPARGRTANQATPGTATR